MTDTEPHHPGDTDHPLVTRASVIYDGMHDLDRELLGRVVPAPVVYDVLGNLKAIGTVLPDVAKQLAEILRQQLQTYTVTEDDGTDPAANVGIAARHLARVAELALTLEKEIDYAQTAIRGQGFYRK